MLDVPADQVEMFRQLKQLMIRIPPDDAAFAGMANVRVQSVRVWMDGIKVDEKDKKVLIRITHTGNEQIAGTSQDIFNFNHEPVNKTFIYNTDNQFIIEEANFGVEQTGEGSTGDYAALGPFTTWHISIDPEDNPYVDVSSIKQIRVEFHGTNYTFD